jgi:hypothetical protein
MAKYSPADLVQLPRFAAPGALALGEQVQSAARPLKKELPKPVTKALAALTTRHKDLNDAIRDQVPADAPESADTPALDRTLDNCWSGLDDFLLGFTKLAGTPQASEAGALRGAIFNDGLKFLKLPYPLEWAESDVRLQRIDKNGLRDRIAKLGGGVFIDEIAKAHAAYGKALGMGAPQTARAVPPEIRAALDAFAASLRTYVVRVMGTVDEDDPATQALADKLLLPFSNWTVGASGRSSPAEGTEGTPPEATPPAEPTGG